MKLNKNQKILVGVGSFAAIVGTVVVVKKVKDRQSANDFVDNVISPTNVSLPKGTFPVKHGDNNQLVKRLQIFLNKVLKVNEKHRVKAGFSKLVEDGSYGENTLRATIIILKTPRISEKLFKKINA